VDVSSSSSSSSSPAAATESNVEKILYSFVRKRSQGGSHAYGLTTVKLLPNGQKVELKQVITSRLYSSLVANARDNSREIVRQRRYVRTHIARAPALIIYKCMYLYVCTHG
jgi:hypothetical protein